MDLSIQGLKQVPKQLNSRNINSKNSQFHSPLTQGRPLTVVNQEVLQFQAVDPQAFYNSFHFEKSNHNNLITLSSVDQKSNHPPSVKSIPIKKKEKQKLQIQQQKPQQNNSNIIKPYQSAKHNSNYQEFYVIKGNKFSKYNQSNATGIRQSTQETTQVLKTEQKSTNLTREFAFTEEDDETEPGSRTKKSYFNQAKTTTMDHTRKYNNISNFSTSIKNMNVTSSGCETKKSIASPSLLMGILNIKQVQRDAINRIHDSIDEKSLSLSPNKDQKINDSMGSFFVKRGGREINISKNSKETTQAMKNGRYFVTQDQDNRKVYDLQQQEKFVQDLNYRNSGYKRSHTQISQASVTQSKSFEQMYQSQKKKPSIYEKREKEFEKVYLEKLIDLKKNGNQEPILESNTNQQARQQPDISLYKERNDEYKVLSNRIKVRALMEERKYVNKNVKTLEKFFDPLRIKMRIMPMSRAPLAQGRNADFYFVESAKISLRGDLTHAIEMLKKGLELKPSHFLCRFNHGVILFKLGLVNEAINDFEMLIKINSKEPATFYNLAICYVQTGVYQNSIDLCEKAILNAKSNPDLLYDIYKVKGICHYRLGCPIETIKCFNIGNRYKPQKTVHKSQAETSKALEHTYINMFIEETRHMFQEEQFQQILLKVSKSQTQLRPTLLDLNNFKRYNSQKNIYVKSQKDLRPQKISSQVNHEVEEVKSECSSNLNFGKAVELKLSMFANRKNTDFKSNYSPLRSPNRRKKSSMGNSPISKSKRKVSIFSSSSYADKLRLKLLIGLPQQAQNEDPIKMLQKLEQQYYEELKEKISNQVNAGFKCRYEKLYNIGDTNPNDLTKDEKDEIEKRLKIEEELKDTDAYKRMLSEDDGSRMLQFLLDMNDIQAKQVVGTTCPISITQVAQEQQNLEFMMEKLKLNFEEKQKEWAKEMKTNNQNLYSKLGLTENQVRDSDEEGGEDFQHQKHREMIISKLKECLVETNITPDDVQNILIKDLEERKRIEQQQKYKSLKSNKRINMPQIDFIKDQFLNQSSQERNIKVLDRILRSFKFFKRFEQDIRMTIYQNAELISLPAQTVIFNQGDIGDKLYVILRGRVCASIQSPEYGNLPLVVATLNDGEQFGELSLINLEKLEDKSKFGEINLRQEAIQSQQFSRRKATCITVEQTDLLAIPKDLSSLLYQPQSTKKCSKRFSKNRKEAFNQEQSQDELNQKINLLQSLSIFEEVDAKLLMPIACNMIAQKFNFGEYVLKEGEIPKGLYILKSGQCKVSSTRIAHRTISKNEFMNKKRGEKKKIRDKDPLFNDYDPDNTLLNEVKSLRRGFQNDRLYVTESGEQIKDKISFQDIMVFSQLMPKNFFGGRVLLPFEMYMNLRNIYFGKEAHMRHYPKGINAQVIDSEPEEKYQLKSLLSVIADSGTVELYILDKNDMGLIPDYILRKVYDKISQLKEPDRPFHESRIEELKEKMMSWETYKIESVEKMMKERFVEKYRGKER